MRAPQSKDDKSRPEEKPNWFPEQRGGHDEGGGAGSKESDAHSGKRRKRAREEPERLPKTRLTRGKRIGENLDRGEGWTVTGPVQSSSWWFLCRSSLGRATARRIRRSRGHPRLATSCLVPMEGERLSRQRNGHVATWNARSHGVTKRCAESVQV